jgi:hypothetical protein
MNVRFDSPGTRLPMVIALTLAAAGANNDGLASPSPLDQKVHDHSVSLREELVATDFRVTSESPFVIVSNESDPRVRGDRVKTLRWAVARLRKDFFRVLPPEPIEVWLLRDRETYRAVSRERFAVEPTSPFGFFVAPRRAIVINIETGNGTLVHEIIHPLMAANFPNCPAWLNEGLASLYEQCTDRDGRIWGLPNWRLRRLQVAIANSRLRTIESLCQTSSSEFYGDDAALNYAEARYLCLYLQENGQLSQYFHQFRHAALDDPSGYQTLIKTVSSDLPVDFQQRWEQFITGLSFGPEG